MNLPYVYTPRPNERVKVDRHGGGTGDVQVHVCGQGAGSIRISADEVPGVAAGILAAMHEAAGLPAQVILERQLRRYCDQVTVDGIRTYLAEGGLVGLDADGDDITPATARIVAARLASLADLAESEPDPAEVAELALVLRAHTPGMAYPTEGDYGLAVATGYAEAALRWFRDRQRGGVA